MPGTFEIQLPHVYQRLLNLYLVLKTSLVFPSSWDKAVCFLASCLEEEGMDPCDAFCMQSLPDILWLILWEENWVVKRTRDKNWQCCITIYLIRPICLRFGSLLSRVISCSTAGFVTVRISSLHLLIHEESSQGNHVENKFLHICTQNTGVCTWFPSQSQTAVLSCQPRKTAVLQVWQWEQRNYFCGIQRTRFLSGFTFCLCDVLNILGCILKAASRYI